MNFRNRSFKPSEEKHERLDLVESSVEEFFKKDVMYKNIPAEAEEYWTSDYQRQKYEKLKTQDSSYKNFILKKYGSFDVYEEEARISAAKNIFDPKKDFHIDVTIITKEKFYVADHISAFEIINEALYGVCTIDFLNNKRQVQRLTGTLYKKYILPSKLEDRLNFYSPLAGNRIGMWNIVKQDWSSFYMSKAIRFVRDDTTDLE